jgi:hypothetical protein
MDQVSLTLAAVLFVKVEPFVMVRAPLFTMAPPLVQCSFKQFRTQEKEDRGNSLWSVKWWGLLNQRFTLTWVAVLPSKVQPLMLSVP